jgi:hypothetical protein
MAVQLQPRLEMVMNQLQCMVDMTKSRTHMLNYVLMFKTISVMVKSQDILHIHLHTVAIYSVIMWEELSHCLVHMEQHGSLMDMVKVHMELMATCVHTSRLIGLGCFSVV